MSSVAEMKSNQSSLLLNRSHPPLSVPGFASQRCDKILPLRSVGKYFVRLVSVSLGGFVITSDFIIALANCLLWGNLKGSILSDSWVFSCDTPSITPWARLTKTAKKEGRQRETEHRDFYFIMSVKWRFLIFSAELVSVLWNVIHELLIVIYIFVYI